MLILIAAGSVVSLVAHLLIGDMAETHEHTVLRLRATEANQFVLALDHRVEARLSTVAALIAQGGPTGFERISSEDPASATLFSALALLHRDGRTLTVTAHRGRLVAPILSADGVPVAGLGTALGQAGYRYVTVVEGARARELQVAEPVPGLGPGWALEAEVALRDSSTAELTRPAGSLAELEFALYLGPQERADRLLATNSTHLPLRGHRATVVTHRGRPRPPRSDGGPGTASSGAESEDLLLVVTPSRPLVGTPWPLIPWLVSGAVMAGALVAALLVGLSMGRTRALARGNRGLQAALEAVREGERNFQRLFDGHPNPMWAYDVESLRFLAVNDAAIERYGYSREEFLAMSITDLEPGEEAGALRHSVQTGSPLDRSGPWRHRCKDGTTLVVEVTSHEQEFAGHRARLALTQDITERVALQDELRHHAFHDALTGLPNRALFNDRVDQAIAARARSGGRIAVLLLDLDDFKSVNDSLGHAAGDELLMEVAAQLRQEVRPCDTAARLGGDEFAVLMEDMEDTGDEIEPVAALAERLVERLDRVYELGGQQIRSTVSIGIAFSLAERSLAADLLRDADIAMYAAKRAGRARWKVFRPDQRDDHIEIQERLALRNDLARAIAGGELFVVYQPQLDLRSGRLTGVEALARWRHARRGRIEPGVFIPIAEHAGLIHDLDAWVLRRACDDARRRAGAGLAPLRVAVNLSGRDLLDPRHAVVDSVAHTLVDAGVAPDDIEIELTESVAVAPHALPILRRLRDLRVHLAVDDFGTGYSSLARLRDFPPDRLKIDHSLVSGIDRSPTGAALVSSIIAMGHSIGLVVVAEGVETEGELRVLIRHGCDEAQGHLIGRPSSAADIHALARAPEAVLGRIIGQRR